MRLAIIVTASALALTGCASSASGQFADFAKQIASDPRCGHIDRVQGNIGGLTGNNLAVYLERTCPAGNAPVPAPTPVTPPAS